MAWHAECGSRDVVALRGGYAQGLADAVLPRPAVPLGRRFGQLAESGSRDVVAPMGGYAQGFAEAALPRPSSRTAAGLFLLHDRRTDRKVTWQCCFLHHHHLHCKNSGGLPASLGLSATEKS